MATLTWLLDVNAPNAAKTFDQIKLRMDQLDANLKKTREVTVGDRSAMATFAKLQLQADRFGEKIHNMPLTLDGAARAEAQLLGLEATADRLDSKLSGRRGFLGRLFRGGGEGGRGGLLGAASGAGGGLISLLGAGGASPYLYGAAGLAAALAAPAAIPLLLGGGTGLGGALLAAGLGTKGAAALQADRQAVAQARAALAGSSTGGTATQHLALQRALAQQARDQRQFGAFAPFGHDVTRLGATATGTLAGALSSGGSGSFLSGLAGILKQIGGFIKSIGPQLGALFRASLPYVSAFVKFLEQAAKLLLPAFVQMLKEMTPFLPVITQGLLNIVKGFVGFLNAIGPSGMKASARIFVILTEAMAAVLVALGHTINWLTENIPTWVRKIHHEWDILRHETAVIFDGIRHEIAHVWDMIFNNTIGRVIRGGHDIEREWNTWTHNIGVIFDRFRHDIASVWDAIWNNTVGRAKKGVGDVLHWVSTLPGAIKRIFNGALTWLLQAGKNVIQGLWNGLTAIWKKVQSFVSGIANWIKSHKGPVHLDATLLEPAGRALMSGLLRGLVGGFGPIAGFVGGVAGKIAGLFGFHGGGSTVALGRAMAASIGWTGANWAALFNLWQGESGWNPRARNPSSGAFGIPQALPPGKMGAAAVAGDAAAQIRWGLGYIRAVYGNPLNAYRMWLSRSPHWYGSGLQGGIFTRPTVIGVGERGPERVDVTPLGSRCAHGGPVVHIDNFNSYDATDPVLLSQRLSFAVTAASLGS